MKKNPQINSSSVRFANECADPSFYASSEVNFISTVSELAVQFFSDSNENREIVNTIIRLAHNQKMEVIAEGIETAEQLEELKTLGCEYEQGYFFSRPLGAGSAGCFISESHVPPTFPPK